MITKTVSPFRVTIILGDDNPVAQVEQMERIIDEGGETITSRILPAETLTMPLSAEILGVANSDLLAEIERLKAAHAVELAELQIQAQPTGGVTKLTIMRRLGDKWPTLKAALLTLPEIVHDAWILAQEIRADDELFLTYGDTLKTMLDLTDAEFTDLLTP